MHKLGVIHRDLKPDNIFISTDDTLKIGDLGISRQIEPNERAKTRIGTPRYAAPEVTGPEGYTLSSDIWSLGILFTEIVTLEKAYIKPVHHKSHICGFRKRHSIAINVPRFDSRFLFSSILN